MSKIENIILNADTEYTINISNVNHNDGGSYKIKVIGPGTWNDDDGHQKK